VPTLSGRRVRALREKRGLKQYELAIYAKVNQGYLSEIERDKTGSVGSQILVGLAAALETNVDYLLGTSDDPRPPSRSRLGDLKPDEEELLKIYRGMADSYLKRQVIDHAQVMADTDQRLAAARRTRSRKRPA
jgi:transcriptional regulator with XRE-family HTH domain